MMGRDGLARFYGTAGFTSGRGVRGVWKQLVQPERERDPGKNGFAVRIKVERAEDPDGQVLYLKQVTR